MVFILIVRPGVGNRSSGNIHKADDNFEEVCVYVFVYMCVCVCVCVCVL